MKDKRLDALLLKTTTLINEVQEQEECFRNLVGSAHCLHCNLGRLYEEIMEYRRENE